ncbi:MULTISPECIES: ABC transporter ATP-binding protein [unclassified Synechocystis]|uniref:ABC transporter ATP-binding protein n=1 Tax=unclassified Synechocystis TaxID=2640012 RepID=UPI000413BFBF|nr:MULTISPECIES: ABC transporter ATP-binding protein [unclassified Synechocystis]AIE74765.1 ABC transporter ATP-binding protein [Synechocystis sp. PCC 6714]MCT0253501.1 ABC transporter ATP-binding protein [Synechocystis sp. CS-94]
MTEPLIQLRGISKSFGDRQILDNVNLDLYPGEALVVIGPSGTGKSTILRIIAGLLSPDSGEVIIKAQPRRGLVEDDNERIRIALVFQQSALFDSLTVAENVGFFLLEHSSLSKEIIREQVAQKLALVGLTGIEDYYPAQLSGGMRKRVSFARAIMSNPHQPEDNPEVILYDEPTAGLDPIASTVIEDLVRRLQRSPEGCGTYIMVSHQESTIRRTADRVVLLYDGRIQWQGSVKAIDETDNPLVRQFFEAKVDGPIRILD